jgi:hypothetical protein
MSEWYIYTVPAKSRLETWCQLFSHGMILKYLNDIMDEIHKRYCPFLISMLWLLTVGRIWLYAVHVSEFDLAHSDVRRNLGEKTLDSFPSKYVTSIKYST